MGPPARKVQHLSLFHHKGDGRGLSIERVFGEVGGAQTVQCTAPLQGALLYSVVQVLVVCRREYGPLLSSYELIGEVVLAVNVTLCERPWGTNPIFKFFF